MFDVSLETGLTWQTDLANIWAGGRPAVVPTMRGQPSSSRSCSLAACSRQVYWLCGRAGCSCFRFESILQGADLLDEQHVLGTVQRGGPYRMGVLKQLPASRPCAESLLFERSNS